MNHLQEEAGYHGQELDEAEIERIFRSNLELVESWVGWSEDIRGGGCWFIFPNEKHAGRWVVGHTDDENRSRHFDDPAKACTYFLLRFLE